MHVWSAFRLKYLNEIRNIDCHIVNGRYATVQVNVVHLSLSLSFTGGMYTYIYQSLVLSSLKNQLELLYTHTYGNQQCRRTFSRFNLFKSVNSSNM